MDAAGYTTLTRQAGLMREMQIVANNIANISTSGFRREGLVFEEFIVPTGAGPSLSMALGNARAVDLRPGPLVSTGGQFDIAIVGEGFFQLDTPSGPRMTRAGSFLTDAAGTLVNADGYPVLDAGGSPLTVPADAGVIAIAADGTLSAGGQPIGRIGLWRPSDPVSLRHEAGTLFSAAGAEPVEGGTMQQGFLEESNVEPVREVARMITVQRAYELGQSFLDMEDRRIRNVVDRLGR